METYSAVPTRVVHLVDWEYSQDEIGYKMLQAAIRAGGFSVMETWSLSLDANAKQILRRCGFRVVDEPDTKRHPAAGPLITKVGDSGPSE